MKLSFIDFQHLPKSWYNKEDVLLIDYVTKFDLFLFFLLISNQTHRYKWDNQQEHIYMLTRVVFICLFLTMGDVWIRVFKTFSVHKHTLPFVFLPTLPTTRKLGDWKRYFEVTFRFGSFESGWMVKAYPHKKRHCCHPRSSDKSPSPATNLHFRRRRFLKRSFDIFIVGAFSFSTVQNNYLRFQIQPIEKGYVRDLIVYVYNK